MEKPFKITFPNGRTAEATRANSPLELSDALRELGLRAPHPTVVLIGGAGGIGEADFSRLRPLFVDVLAPLVEAHGAFVVDGGTDVGVMRLMGQARTETRSTFPLVGVAVEVKVVFPGAAPSSRDASPLDPHHTHFVLVPGSDWGDESPWLASVARELAREASSITVLVNGGETAREDVSQSLRAGRPLVVVAGTGRLADEIAADRKRAPLLHVGHLAEGSEKVAAVMTSLLKGGQDGQV